MNVVSYEGEVEEYGEPLPGAEEQNIDQNMEDILRQHQGVQTVALINRVLVVSFQLIESNNLKHERLSLNHSP